MTPTGRLRQAGAALGMIVVGGTIAYRVVEGASWADSLYMVLMTVSTVGFAEVFPLGPAGRFVTAVLIVVGVGTALYTAGIALEIAVVQVSDRGRKARMQRDIDGYTNHQIVCGFGRVGHAAWQDILEHRADVVVIESDPEAADEARAAGAVVVEGDATHNDVLLAAGIERAAGLIACVSSDSDNLVIVLSARSLNFNLPVVSRANDEESEEKILLAGANRVVAPQRVGARRMAAMALQPGLADFVDLVIQRTARRVPGREGHCGSRFPPRWKLTQRRRSPAAIRCHGACRRATRPGRRGQPQCPGFHPRRERVGGHRYSRADRGSQRHGWSGQRRFLTGVVDITGRHR